MNLIAHNQMLSLYCKGMQWKKNHIVTKVNSLVSLAADIFDSIFSGVNFNLLKPHLRIRNCSNICGETFLSSTYSVSFQHNRQSQKRFLCVCGNKWWCEMNGKRDSLMIMRRLIFLEYPVGAQPIGCQIKAPVSMTKCSPFSSTPATVD